MAVKPRDAAVEFDTYRNVQRHRAVLPEIARHLVKLWPQLDPTEPYLAKYVGYAACAIQTDSLLTYYDETED